LDAKSTLLQVDHWAASHRISTPVRVFRHALGSPDERLLAGSLAFLGQPETRDVLDAWEVSGPLPAELEPLSTCMQLSPLLYSSLASSGSITTHLRTKYPVAAMLCVQVTRGFDDSQLRDFASLRLYLLAKAIENWRAGYEISPRIAEASKYLGNFLGDPIKYPDGVEWISELCSANRHLPTYEVGIVESAKRLISQLKANKASIKNWSAGEHFAGSLQAIAERRPEELTLLPDQLRVGDSYSATIESRFVPPDLNFPALTEQVLTLAPTQVDEEDDEPTELVVFESSPTAEHRFRVGLGLQLETQAQRNRIPFAWDRVRPEDEMECLFETIVHWLDSSEHQLLGAIAALALATGSSIEVACSLKIASAPVDSRWVLDLDRGVLVRLPSRPVSRAIAPGSQGASSGVASRWVRPLAELQELQLSPRLLAPLIAAQQKRGSPEVLGDLWPDEVSPQTTFDRRCDRTPGLERVSQGMLKATADQLIFQWTQDSVFCRMLLTTDLALRPSACSYAAWTLSQTNNRVQALSGNHLTPTGNQSGDANGLGSEIDPDDQRIRDALESATARLEKLLVPVDSANPPDWVEVHNAITIYCVVLLLAYTGARPTRSVFETLGDFDLENRRLFIDDKVIRESATGRWGRIVPLPDQGVELLLLLYLPYLRWLMEKLALHAGTNVGFGDLSKAIASQLDKHSKPAIPLFFLITKSPVLRIVEVSESAIERSTLFDWPLPANVFRHRMATRLRQLPGGDDLAAAQLGHAEAGTDVYGAISPRCWVDDQKRWAEALAKVLGPITVPPVRLANPGWDITDKKSDFSRFLTAGEFGSTARSEARSVTRELAGRQAIASIHEQVAQWLGEAANPALHIPAEAFPDQLSEDQVTFLSATDRWTKLGLKMIYIDGKTPRANHAIWYETYERFRANACRDTYGQMNDRLVVKRKHGSRFAFSRSVLHAQQRLQSVRICLDQAFSSIAPSTRSLADHSLLVALDLALTSMVSDPKLLGLIEPKQKDSLRLHTRDSVVYLARKSPREERDAPPFAWHCVPARSVTALLALKGSTGRDLGSKLVPKALKKFARQLEQTLELTADSLKERHQLIKVVADLAHEHNQLYLPGIVAAARRADIATWSLSSYCQARSQFGIYADTLKDATPSDQETSEQSQTIATPSILTAAGDRKSEEILLKGVRAALREFENKAKGKNWSDRARKETATLIEKKLRSATRLNADHGVSTTLQLLIAWILNMLREPGASGKELRASSVRTYLSLLASAFLDFGREVDLLEADEEEIECFYARVLSRPVDKAQRRRAHDGNGRRLDEHSVLGRLRDFHTFIERRYGAESPDWSALGEDLTSSQVSAEIITESEYEAALQALCPLGSTFDRDAYLEAFLLILGYRFGLRSGEAISMARRDWISVHRGYVVLVSGAYKEPKSKAGRRQIPLLGQLSDHERSIVEGWLEFWNDMRLPSSSAPLFPALSNPKIPSRINEHRLRVIQTLRLVTGSDRVTFHHARHSFASMLSLRLLSPGLADKMQGRKSELFWDPADVQLQLLGIPSITRRSAWALAVALGHAHPETTLVSYCHFVHDWANVLAAVSKRANLAVRPRF